MNISQISILLLLLLVYFNCSVSSTTTRYLLYDVNWGEGFNLRRDVYIRMANLIRILNIESEKSGQQWTLVLPQWGRIYHWFNMPRDDSGNVHWSRFFHLPSLRLFIPVIEWKEYLELNEKHFIVDEAYTLQHFEDFGKNWEERFQVETCRADQYLSFYQSSEDVAKFGKDKAPFSGWFFGVSEMRATKFQCLSVHLEASKLRDFLLKHTRGQSIMLDRTEVLHSGQYSEWSNEWWTARRSMVFSHSLQKDAQWLLDQQLDCMKDREQVLQHVHRADDWRVQTPKHAVVRGCTFLAVHLRRRDFLNSHASDVPSLSDAARQIMHHLKELKVETGKQEAHVFLATDAPQDEVIQLEKLLINAGLPSGHLLSQYNSKVHESKLDGERAIIDQIICSRARRFVGTRQSTFSFRISEERSIMKLPYWYTFCATWDAMKNNSEKCSHPDVWPVMYEDGYTFVAGTDYTAAEAHSEL